MGGGVFGSPITNATLERPIDRARVALERQDSHGKVEARKYLQRLKATCGHDMGTRCLVYNATGDTLNYASKTDWAGKNIRSSPYPNQIANGQWGAFLHVNDAAGGILPAGGILSMAAVVYHGKDADGADCDWLVAWRSKRTADSVDSTKAYNEVREKDHFSKDNGYHIVAAANKVLNAGLSYSDDYNADHWKGTSSHCASIPCDNFPILMATLTLEGADLQQQGLYNKTAYLST